MARPFRPATVTTIHLQRTSSVPCGYACHHVTLFLWLQRTTCIKPRWFRGHTTPRHLSFWVTAAATRFVPQIVTEPPHHGTDFVKADCAPSNTSPLLCHHPHLTHSTTPGASQAMLLHSSTLRFLLRAAYQNAQDSSLHCCRLIPLLQAAQLHRLHLLPHRDCLGNWNSTAVRAPFPAPSFFSTG